MLRRLLHNSFHLGDAENAARVLAFASDPNQPEALRIEAFRLVSNWLKPFPVDQFTGHSRPLPDRDPAVLLPLLNEKIPDLLTRKDFALTAALELIEAYDLQVPGLDDAALRAIITDDALPADARAKALDLLTRLAPADLDSFLAEIIRNAPDPVALTALSHLAKISPAPPSPRSRPRSSPAARCSPASHGPCSPPSPARRPTPFSSSISISC